MIQVVKIGGHVLEDPAQLEAFCRDFAALEGPKVLVHGGGEMAGRIQHSLGIEPVCIEGRRVTDEATLQVVTMVYAGWCNKHLVARLQALGCDALGLAGCDAGVITARRRPPKTLSDGHTVVDYGWVGDVTPASVHAGRLRRFLGAGLTPVLCAINHDGAGRLLNTNADTVAASVATALQASLTYCFEKDGVLDAAGNVIPELTPKDYAALKVDGAVSGGMVPKLDNAFAALAAGAAQVIITSAAALGKSGGTTLKPA